MTTATPDPRIAVAQANADAARLRLSRTLGTLQHRASPSVIAHDVADSIKERGIEAIAGAVETAKRKPVPVGIGAAAVALFLARGPITRAIRYATGAKSRR